ncbi:MAG: arginine decarboxylase, partial [Bdellovibrionales bacterium RIFOXYC2_FULL_39_8]
MNEGTTNKTNDSDAWSIEDSKRLYNIEQWGQEYFSINNNGNLAIFPEQDSNGPCIDMGEVIDEIKSHKINLPVLVRFQDLLRSQVIKLNETFGRVIKEAKYQGQYFGVYPIKVNQMREVVEEILDAGHDYNYGLEAGSKPELIAALALNDNTSSLTVLNGFKDQDYLRLALLGRKMDRKIIIVVEKYSELIDTVKIAEEFNVEPIIGFRAKLSSRGSGKWASSGGDRAKFGLSIPELMKGINFLKSLNKEHWIKLFHFHIGSQITDIRTIKDAISEGARIFCKIHKLGIPLEYFDVGGGLGVDYDGSRSTEDSSTNYTMNDYVEDVVYIVKQICDMEKVPHPNIVSESGRAITALHSCVIMNIVDQISTDSNQFPTECNDTNHILVRNFRDLWTELNEDNFQETYNDAIQKKDEIINAFKLGILSLE